MTVLQSITLLLVDSEDQIHDGASEKQSIQTPVKPRANQISTTGSSYSKIFIIGHLSKWLA